LSTLVQNSASGDALTADKISQEEIDLIVVPALCDILGFYVIPSELCPDIEAPNVSIGNKVNDAASG